MLASCCAGSDVLKKQQGKNLVLEQNIDKANTTSNDQSPRIP